MESKVTDLINVEDLQKNKIRKQIELLVDQYASLEFSNKKFIPGITPVPPSGKLIAGEELKNMVNASLDGWLTTGRFNELFEKKLAEFLGVRHAITVNSGSSANLVAFTTLTSKKLGSRAISPNDEVITVAAGFPTTVNPIIQVGAVPVFVDIDRNTHNIDASKVEAAISSKTKAIVLANSLGNPFNLAVLNCGAPACGVNAAIRSFVRLGIAKGCRIYAIYGGFEGVKDGAVSSFNFYK